MTHVPYRGEVPILSDIVAGHVDVFFGTLSTALPLFQSKKLRFVAAASAKRSRLVPDVPTIDNVRPLRTSSRPRGLLLSDRLACQVICQSG